MGQNSPVSFPVLLAVATHLEDFFGFLPEKSGDVVKNPAKTPLFGESFKKTKEIKSGDQRS